MSERTYGQQHLVDVVPQLKGFAETFDEHVQREREYESWLEGKRSSLEQAGQFDEVAQSDYEHYRQKLAALKQRNEMNRRRLNTLFGAAKQGAETHGELGPSSYDRTAEEYAEKWTRGPARSALEFVKTLPGDVAVGVGKAAQFEGTLANALGEEGGKYASMLLPPGLSHGMTASREKRMEMAKALAESGEKNFGLSFLQPERNIDNTLTFGETIGQQFGQMAPAIGASVATGGLGGGTLAAALAGGAVAGAQEGQGQEERLLEEGLDPRTAAMSGLRTAGVVGAMSTIPVGRIAGKFSGKQFAGQLDDLVLKFMPTASKHGVSRELVKIGLDAGSEGSEEALTTLWTEYMEGQQLVGNRPDVPWDQIKAEMREAFLVGGLVGGMASGAGSIFGGGKSAPEAAPNSDLAAKIASHHESLVDKSLESRSAEENARIEKRIVELAGPSLEYIDELEQGIQQVLDSGEANEVTQRSARRSLEVIKRLREPDALAARQAQEQAAAEQQQAAEQEAAIKEWAVGLDQQMRKIWEKDPGSPQRRENLAELGAMRSDPEMAPVLDAFLAMPYDGNITWADALQNELAQESADRLEMEAKELVPQENPVVAEHARVVQELEALTTEDSPVDDSVKEVLALLSDEVLETEPELGEDIRQRAQAVIDMVSEAPPGWAMPADMRAEIAQWVITSEKARQDGEAEGSAEGAEEGAPAAGEAKAKAPEADAGRGGTSGRGDLPRDGKKAEQEKVEAYEKDRRGPERKPLSKMTKKELLKEILTDPLTGAPSRRAFIEREGKGEAAAKAVIDADSLKYINDHFGHEAGDHLLMMISDALAESGLEYYRVGGDEFYVRADSESAIEQGVQKAREWLGRHRLELENIKTGEKFYYDAPEITHGTATTIEAADKRLVERKIERQERGERAARGERPRKVAQVSKSQEGRVQAKGSAKVIAKRALDGVLESGGATIPLTGGPSPTTGFAVATDKFGEKTEFKFPDDRPNPGKLIDQYVEEKLEQTEDPAGLNIGAWVHEGDVYLDVSEVFDSKADALAQAKRLGEKAIFDLETGEEIPVEEGVVKAQIDIAPVQVARSTAHRRSAIDLVSLRTRADVPVKTSSKNSPRRTVLEIAKFLQTWARRTGGRISPSSYLTRRGATKRQRTASLNRIANVMAEEVIYALSLDNSGRGWYDANTSSALGIYSLVHPELLTDRRAEFHFKLILAVTSNGMKVTDNAKHAEALYQQWKEHGDLSRLEGTGTRVESMNKSFKNLQRLISEMGWEKLESIFTTKSAVKEQQAIYKELGWKYSPADLATEEIYGASILGSKIGSFFANLYGHFDSLTADLWFTRTFNRYTGELLPDKLSIAETRKIEHQKLIEQIDEGEFVDVFGLKPDLEKLKNDHEYFLDWAKKTLNLFRSSGKKPILQEDGSIVREEHTSFRPKNDTNRIAKRAIEINSITEAPRNKEERSFMRAAAEKAAAIVEERTGEPLEIADLQAILWYLEKRVYAQLGYKANKKTDLSKPVELDVEESYEGAAERVAKDSGLSQEEIDAAKQRGIARGHGGRRAGADRDIKAQVETVSDVRKRSLERPRQVATYYHFSAEPRGQLERRFAGTGKAGQERSRFRNLEDGTLDPESAAVHFYTAGAKPEPDVLGGGKGLRYMHKVESDWSLLETTSQDARVLFEEAKRRAAKLAGGDPLLEFSKLVKEAGYDGIVQDGMVQVYADVAGDLITSVEDIDIDDRLRFIKEGLPKAQLEGAAETGAESTLTPDLIEQLRGKVKRAIGIDIPYGLDTMLLDWNKPADRKALKAHGITTAEQARQVRVKGLWLGNAIKIASGLYDAEGNLVPRSYDDVEHSTWHETFHAAAELGVLSSVEIGNLFDSVWAKAQSKAEGGSFEDVYAAAEELVAEQFADFMSSKPVDPTGLWGKIVSMLRGLAKQFSQTEAEAIFDALASGKSALKSERAHLFAEFFSEPSASGPEYKLALGTREHQRKFKVGDSVRIKRGAVEHAVRIDRIFQDEDGKWKVDFSWKSAGKGRNQTVHASAFGAWVKAVDGQVQGNKEAITIIDSVDSYYRFLGMQPPEHIWNGVTPADLADLPIKSMPHNQEAPGLGANITRTWGSVVGRMGEWGRMLHEWGWRVDHMRDSANGRMKSALKSAMSHAEKKGKKFKRGEKAYLLMLVHGLDIDAEMAALSETLRKADDKNKSSLVKELAFLKRAKEHLSDAGNPSDLFETLTVEQAEADIESSSRLARELEGEEALYWRRRARYLIRAVESGKEKIRMMRPPDMLGEKSRFAYPVMAFRDVDDGMYDEYSLLANEDHTAPFEENHVPLQISRTLLRDLASGKMGEDSITFETMIESLAARLDAKSASDVLVMPEGYDTRALAQAIIDGTQSNRSFSSLVQDRYPSARFGPFAKRRGNVIGLNFIDWSMESTYEYAESSARAISEWVFAHAAADKLGLEGDERKSWTPNKAFQRAFKGTLPHAGGTKGMKDWVQGYVGRMLGRTPSAPLDRATAGLAKLQHVTKLSAMETTVRNLGAISTIGLASFGPINLLRAMKVSLSRMGDGSVLRSGATSGSLLLEDTFELSQKDLDRIIWDNETGKLKSMAKVGASWMQDAMLLGFTQSERLLRTISAHAAHLDAMSMVDVVAGRKNFLQSLTTKTAARRKLKEFYRLTDQEIESAVAGFPSSVEPGESGPGALSSVELAERFESKVMYNGAIQSNFIRSPNMLPRAMELSTLFRTFKSFAWSVLKWQGQYVWKEAFKGNPKPMVYLLAGIGITAPTINFIIRSLFKDEEDEKEFAGDRILGWEDPAARWLRMRFVDLQVTGVLGMLERPMDFTNLMDFVFGVHARTFSNASKTFKDIDVRAISHAAEDEYGTAFTQAASSVWRNFVKREIGIIKTIDNVNKKWGITGSSMSDYTKARQLARMWFQQEKSRVRVQHDEASEFQISAWAPERDKIVKLISAGKYDEAREVIGKLEQTIVSLKSREAKTPEAARRDVRQSLVAVSPLGKVSSSQDPEKAREDLEKFKEWVEERSPGSDKAEKYIDLHVAYLEAMELVAPKG